MIKEISWRLYNSNLGKTKQDCLVYLHTAKAFLESSEKLTNSLGRPTVDQRKVLYNLIGISFELIFKSFLRMNGYEKKDLKKINHNLTDLYRKTRKKGLDILNKEEVKLVINLNIKYYRDKEFKYSTQYINLPPPKDYFPIANNLYRKVKNMVDRSPNKPIKIKFLKSYANSNKIQ